jgi:2-keto-4-pentenoate hydratase/2-oxohepta-3-ene-1,7-dioic acid hydratase in catechol pathway
MKYCRFQFNGKTEYGLVESIAGQEVITRLLLKPPETADDPEDLPTKSIPRIALNEAELAVPVRPSKIVCVGRNYRAHAAELGNEVPTEPLIFLKPPSSLLPSGGTILRPKTSKRTDFEGELAIVMARKCHKLPADTDVKPFILGYTALNDFTARDLQKQDSQWTRGKGYDTFCPVGPVVTNELDPWAGITVETRVNGEVRQNGNTRDFIFPIEVILRYIAEFMTLVPGDVIATGTPEGVGPVVAGDVIEVNVEGVGTLRNSVADEQD